jgi:hypothetical protein
MVEWSKAFQYNGVPSVILCELERVAGNIRSELGSRYKMFGGRTKNRVVWLSRTRSSDIKFLPLIGPI